MIDSLIYNCLWTATYLFIVCGESSGLKVNYYCQICTTACQECYHRKDGHKGVLLMMLDLIRAMWKSFLAQTEGKPFRFVFPSASDTTMTSDASGAVGYGCVMERFWFSGLWNDEWLSKQNIALLELIPIYIGTQLWMQKLSNSTIIALTDNGSMVAMINTFFSREKTIN